MSTPEQVTTGAVVRQIGVGEDGTPIFTYVDRTPVVQPTPIRSPRPVGAYVAAGVGGAVAVSALALSAAILAIAVSIGAVAVTICVIVLRSMWERYLADKEGK